MGLDMLRRHFVRPHAMPRAPVPPDIDDFLQRPNPAVVASLRRDGPRVALTVLDQEGWHRHVGLLGRIVAIEEDVGLRDIDHLAVHYTGEPFRTRDRRRFTAWMEIDAWHAWEGSQPWPTPS